MRVDVGVSGERRCVGENGGRGRGSGCGVVPRALGCGEGCSDRGGVGRRRGLVGGSAGRVVERARSWCVGGTAVATLRRRWSARGSGKGVVGAPRVAQVSSAHGTVREERRGSQASAGEFGRPSTRRRRRESNRPCRVRGRRSARLGGGWLEWLVQRLPRGAGRCVLGGRCREQSRDA